MFLLNEYPWALWISYPLYILYKYIHLSTKSPPVRYQTVINIKATSLSLKTLTYQVKSFSLAGSTGQKLLVNIIVMSRLNSCPLLHYPVRIPQQVRSIYTTWFVSHKTPSTSLLISVPTLWSSTQIVPSTSTNPKLLPQWFLRFCLSLLKPSKTFVHLPTPSHHYTLLPALIFLHSPHCSFCPFVSRWI